MGMAKAQNQGVAFRSELEAQWSVFFEEAGVQWEYHSGARLFWLASLGVWVKVADHLKEHMDTTEAPTADFLECSALARETRCSVLWLAGPIPDLSFDCTTKGLPVAIDHFYCLGFQGASWTEITPDFNWLSSGWDGLDLVTEYDCRHRWLFDE